MQEVTHAWWFLYRTYMTTDVLFSSRERRHDDKYKRHKQDKLIITLLTRESLVSDIPAGDEKMANLFLQCN